MTASDKSPFDPVFDVKWTNQHETFAYGISVLYDKKQQFDLTITLKDGKELEAHRSVMGIVSSTIRDKLEDLPKKPKANLKFKTISFKTMNQLLKYIYKGTVSIPKRDGKEFIRAARALKVYTTLNDVDLDSLLKTDEQKIDFIWSKRGEQFAESFATLRSIEQDFDVALKIDNIELRAHRVALSAVSPFFERMLSILPGELLVTLPMHQFPDLTYARLENLLDYIYNGNVQVNDIVVLGNDGFDFEILGLKGGNYHALRPKKNDDEEFDDEKNELWFEIFITADNIPDDFKLKKDDIVVSVEEFKTNSALEKSGTEYEPENDSDLEVQRKVMSGQQKKNIPRAQKKATARKQAQPKRAAEKKKIEPRNQPGPSTSSDSNQNDAEVPAGMDDHPEAETVTLTMSKHEYDQMMRIMKAHMSTDQNNNNNDEDLDVSHAHQFDADGYDDLNGEPNCQNDPSLQNVEEGAVGGLGLNEQNNRAEDQVIELMVPRKSTKKIQKDYNVTAQIVKSKSGKDLIVNDGYRYCRNQINRFDVRWQCTKKKQQKHCSAKAYSMDINGVTMVSLPPESAHQFGSVCRCPTIPNSIQISE